MTPFSALVATGWGVIFFYIIARDAYLGLFAFRIWYGFLALSYFLLFAALQFLAERAKRVRTCGYLVMVYLPAAYTLALVYGFITYFGTMFINPACQEWSTVRDGVRENRLVIKNVMGLVYQPAPMTGFFHEGARSKAEFGCYFNGGLPGMPKELLLCALRENILWNPKTHDMTDVKIFYYLRQEKTYPIISFWDAIRGDVVEEGTTPLWGIYKRYESGMVESANWGRFRPIDEYCIDHSMLGFIYPHKVADGQVYFK